MHVKIVSGRFTDRQLLKCYDYLYEVINHEGIICKSIDRRTEQNRVQHPKPNTGMQREGKDN